MTRVEENKEQIENLLDKEEQLLSNPFAGTFESAMVLKTTLITSLLIDISKSLAIQADAAVEANKLKKNMDGVPPTITPQEPFKPMVEIDLYSVIKQKYIEREILDKIRAEIEKETDRDDHADEYCDGYYDGMRKALAIIDKHKAESEKEVEDKK